MNSTFQKGRNEMKETVVYTDELRNGLMIKVGGVIYIGTEQMKKVFTRT